MNLFPSLKQRQSFCIRMRRRNSFSPKTPLWSKSTRPWEGLSILAHQGEASSWGWYGWGLFWFFMAFHALSSAVPCEEKEVYCVKCCGILRLGRKRQVEGKMLTRSQGWRLRLLPFFILQTPSPVGSVFLLVLTLFQLVNKKNLEKKQTKFHIFLICSPFISKHVHVCFMWIGNYTQVSEHLMSFLNATTKAQPQHG